MSELNSSLSGIVLSTLTAVMPTLDLSRGAHEQMLRAELKLRINDGRNNVAKKCCCKKAEQCMDFRGSRKINNKNQLCLLRIIQSEQKQGRSRPRQMVATF